MALAYSAVDWELLAADIRGHTMDNDALGTEINEYGGITRSVVEPKAKRQGAVLMTVCSVLRGEGFPRLVTAFPGARS